jgi:Histone chaperone domain CHZ
MPGPAILDDILCVAWRVISVADLETLTPKHIRAEVRSELGKDCLQFTEDELKRVVKGIIPDLMARREREDAEKAGRAASSAERTNQPSRLKRKKQAKETRAGNIRLEGGTKTVQRESTGASETDAGKPRSRTRRIGPHAEGDSSDDSERAPKNEKPNAEEGDWVIQSSKVCQPLEASNLEAEPKPISCANEMSEENDSNPSVPSMPTQPVIQRRKTVGRARKRGREDTELAKILKLSRELGCRIPPRVLACDVEDKVDACIAYLRTKGVKGDVCKMNSATIKELRARLERDKELDELDVSNIIASDSRRPRRAAASAHRVASGLTAGDGGSSISGREREEDSDASSSESAESRSESEFELSQS